jgi:hypothetical protein
LSVLKEVYPVDAGSSRPVEEENLFDESGDGVLHSRRL